MPPDIVHCRDNSSEGETPLYCAASKGHHEVVELLLKVPNVDVNSKSHGYTPLHEAIERDFPEYHKTCDMLLSASNIDANARNQDGCTPLMSAAQESNMHALKALSNIPTMNPHAKDDDGKNALHFAVDGDLNCFGGKPTAMRVVMERFQTDIDVVDYCGQTALHLAAASEVHKTLEYLLSLPGMCERINATTGDGSTPLHMAVQSFEARNVELLLKVPSIDVDVQDNVGSTPLHMVLSSASECNDSTSISSYECIAGMLLNMPAINVNLKDDDGRAPLHIASYNFFTVPIDERICKMPNADVNVQDNRGLTPLHMAVCGPDKHIAGVLMNLPTIAINRQDHKGRTPLHTGIRSISRCLVCCYSK